jgi:hypothetical protein
MDVRQTALVNLKTTVDSSYVALQPGQFELSAQDKTILRDSILEGKIYDKLSTHQKLRWAEARAAIFLNCV